MIGGTKTTGDVVTLTIYDAGLTTGSKAISYTVLPTDTIASILNGLAASLNSDPDLGDLRITAFPSNQAIFITSATLNTTTYKCGLNSGATESFNLAKDSNSRNYSCNSVNEITTITAGGAFEYTAEANKALKSASLSGSSARLQNSKLFTSKALLTGGSNQVIISASGGDSLVETNQYQQENDDIQARSLAFDLNGNLQENESYSYIFDAADRLVKIIYPEGATSILYDAEGCRAKIIESSNGTVIKTIFYIENEERDIANQVTRQVFSGGEIYEEIKRFYFQDSLNSISEHTDESGMVTDTEDYSQFGTPIHHSGISYDPGFAGMRFHQKTGLNLTYARAYSSSLGRWLSRDPIGESYSRNLYSYANNNPVTYRDPYGYRYSRPGDPTEGAEPMGCEEFLLIFPAERLIIPVGGWIIKLTGLNKALASLGARIASRKGCCSSKKLGDLTAEEIRQIQKVVDKAGRPLDVVGSAAKGARHAKSDIDYTAASASHEYFKGLESGLPKLDSSHGILRGSPSPFEGPSIRFEPGVPPSFIPKQ